jgi:hypothetical protein
MDNKFPNYKDHLNKTFLEELGYKFWATKGIRFKASSRLLTKNDLSNKALAFLSSYLIILSLLFVYNVINDQILSSNFIAFGSTALSILILVFSQIEYAQDYKTRASQYQKCALEISVLYDKIRIQKTLNELDNDSKVIFCKKLSKKYQRILENYPNHEDIDYQFFKNEHSKYFELTFWRKQHTYFNYYVSVKLIYHALIFIPPVVILYAVFL